MRMYPLAAELKDPKISSVSDLVNDDPELTQAVELLVLSLSRVSTQEGESRAWLVFTDTVKYLISRAETQIIREYEEPSDDTWEGA